VKLAVVQFCPAFCDRDESIRRLDPLLDSCRGADLIVLPELSNSGYNFKSRDEAMQCAEPVDSGPFLDYLTRKSGELNCEIVAGFNERAGDRLYNSAALLSAVGLEGWYRKMHLFVDEPDYFQPGDLGLPVFDRDYGTIGILICFDWCFCETWRILALRGAELICHPSNLVIPGKAQKAVPVHAMTNRVFIATANRIGTERELTFTGLSLIADPRGEVLCQASQAQAGVTTVELDPAQARDKAMTRRNDAFGDRRPDEYGDICREAW
jgi:predicted amidohydrolase